MPSVSRIPTFLTALRHPRRNRAVSVGPQSAADAYEALAFRHKRRRESLADGATTTSTDRKVFQQVDASEKPEILGVHKATRPELGPIKLPTPASSDINLPASASSTDVAVQTPLTPNDSNQSLHGMVRTASQDRRQEVKEEQEMFSRLERPRVRYDVEVITKLIVYFGRYSRAHWSDVLLTVTQASVGSR
jgi:hypothetical protein